MSALAAFYDMWGGGIMNVFGSESNYQNNRKIHFTFRTALP